MSDFKVGDVVYTVSLFGDIKIKKHKIDKIMITEKGVYSFIGRKRVSKEYRSFQHAKQSLLDKVNALQEEN